MPLSLPQLTLALFENANSELADYVAGPNQLALDGLRRWLDGEGPWFLLLSGRYGTGKSHLIRAAVQALGEQKSRAIYVPLREVIEFGPAILDELESINFIAIDDIHLAAGNRCWEEALFNLFNRTEAAGASLLVSSRDGPLEFQFDLADLRSRLSSGLTYILFDLDDADKQQALQKRAANRGLSMPDNVARYLITRLRRDMHELTVIFERIDAASLSAGRELTVPFVREVLGGD
ncbi:MAG: DnaA regulatory inactivator Hda [Proteobacteria bacterium]|nr:DnaA regulatory inactivator Hda [Pseudomonadota bacterium]